MSFLTEITRMWLTRSTRKFSFYNEYDEHLPYGECDNLGLYIHIPFCKSICGFCPYCKVIYSEEKCNKYIDSLIHEIHMEGNEYEGKKTVTSLYFGGGTPALAIDRIEEILDAVREHFIITEGIGLELHPDNVTYDTLTACKKAGITKLSIGIQSFQEKYQDILGRRSVNIDPIRDALSKVSFETVSMDFIFALPTQTIDDLKNDIDMALKLGANYVAIYPFIDFSFTKSDIKALDNKKKRAMLDEITMYCLEKGFKRSSIWTFATESSAKYSSMTRDNFLGFGCSATTLLKKQFKINTFDVDEYCKRIESGKLATSLTIRFTLRQRMVYYLFWMAYSTKVNADDFERFFGVKLSKMYGMELKLAQLFKLITYKDGTYEMTLKGAFYYHYYEKFYTYSYIDKMWGIMRKEAFPKQIKF